MPVLTIFNIHFYNTSRLKALQNPNCQRIATYLSKPQRNSLISQTHLDTAKYFRIFAVWEKAYS